MNRPRRYALIFAVLVGLCTTFNQTARAGSWPWETVLSVFSSETAVSVCVTDPVVINLADTGAGSLRQAVTDACDGATITFAPGVTERWGCMPGRS